MHSVVLPLSAFPHGGTPIVHHLFCVGLLSSLRESLPRRGKRPQLVGARNLMQDSIEHLLSRCENDHSLFEADQLSRRLEVLDRIDSHFSCAERNGIGARLVGSRLERRTRAICARLETANSKLYHSIRLQIRQGIAPAKLLRAVQELSGDQRLLRHVRGMGYDHLDELLGGVFDFERPKKTIDYGSSEVVAYQPTPARHIFSLVSVAPISESDILLDLGAGLGHVPLLVSVCTGARAIGVELQPSYVACARRCARQLNLSSVDFLEQDARDADLSRGTVFYLYTPFTGSMLRAVMDSLRSQAAVRPIKICTLGPCTPVFAQQRWLKAATNPGIDRITVFLSVPRGTSARDEICGCGEMRMLSSWRSMLCARCL